MPKANTIVVLDFETTGLSPDQGDRAIEIGAVRIVEGEITDSFQALMNPGMRVDNFIEGYTGITNEMLEGAEPCRTVMNRFADYIGDDNLLAHNASFDRRFLDAEFERIRRDYSGEFVCSLLTSRRIFQSAPNHKLGTLIDYTNIATDGSFHRALFDAEMTAKLWLKIIEIIQQQVSIDHVPFALIQKLCVTPKKNVAKFLLNWKAKTQT